MPASTLLLITIGILSLCVMFVHILIRQHQSRASGHRRTTVETPDDIRHADWLKPSRERELTSVSM